jgi:hypothetical protein
MKNLISPKEIPERYRKRILGKDETSIIVEDEDPNKVLIFTRDYSKVEWLVHGIRRYNISPGEVLKSSLYKLESVDKRPIICIRLQNLHFLSKKNKKLVKEQLKLFKEIEKKCRLFSISESETQELIRREYQLHHEESILYPLMKFESKYKDILNLNEDSFMEDDKGNLIVTDPLIERKIIEFLNTK